MHMYVFPGCARVRRTRDTPTSYRAPGSITRRIAWSLLTRDALGVTLSICSVLISVLDGHPNCS